jgi:magnesium-transporting ATPase (P-type)
LGFAALGGGQYMIVATTNVCLMEIAKDKAGRWIPITHGMIGVGALTAPLIVKFMEIKAFYVLAVINIVYSILCLYFRTPIRSKS